MPMMPPEIMEKLVEDAGGWAAVLATPYRPTTLYDMILPTEAARPHFVYYRNGKATHLPPDRFLLRMTPWEPSDCCWIVPGTGQ